MLSALGIGNRGPDTQPILVIPVPGPKFQGPLFTPVRQPEISRRAVFSELKSSVGWVLVIGGSFE